MEDVTTTLHVIGLCCNRCEQRIARVLEQLPGVTVLRTDYELGEVELVMPSTRISLEEVQDQLELEGYQIKDMT